MTKKAKPRQRAAKKRRKQRQKKKTKDGLTLELILPITGKPISGFSPLGRELRNLT